MYFLLKSLVYLKSMIFQICYIRIGDLAPLVHLFIERILCQVVFLTLFRTINIQTKFLCLWCLYLLVLVAGGKGACQVGMKRNEK